jgi:hypothetical protein
MAKKIITIGKKGVTEKIEGSGPITDLNINYPNGNNSEDAGKAFSERKKPLPITKNGSPFNGAWANLWATDGTGFPLFPKLEQGEWIDIVLFTPDVPVSLESRLNFTSPIWVGATQVAAGPATYYMTGRPPRIDNSLDVITELTGNRSAGVRKQYETSEGVKCWGYGASMLVPEYGFLDASGGAPLSAFVEIRAFSAGEIFGCAGPLPSGDIIGAYPVLIREDQLTEEMLDNPRFRINYFSGPLDLLICGIYAVRP